MDYQVTIVIIIIISMRDAKHLLNGTGVPVVTVVPVIVCRRMPVARNATL